MRSLSRIPCLSSAGQDWVSVFSRLSGESLIKHSLEKPIRRGDSTPSLACPPRHRAKFGWPFLSLWRTLSAFSAVKCGFYLPSAEGLHNLHIVVMSPDARRASEVGLHFVTMTITFTLQHSTIVTNWHDLFAMIFYFGLRESLNFGFANALRLLTWLHCRRMSIDVFWRSKGNVFQSLHSHRTKRGSRTCHSTQDVIEQHLPHSALWCGKRRIE